MLSFVFHIIAAGVSAVIFTNPATAVSYPAELTEEFEVSADEFYDFTVGNYKMLKKGESSVYDTVSDDGSLEQSGSSEGSARMSVLTYNEAVKQLIERKKEYPPNARKRGLEGEIIVSFVIDRKGRLKSSQIKKSSGHEILDEAAVSTIKDASPFPEFGTLIKSQELELQINVAYRL